MKDDVENCKKEDENDPEARKKENMNEVMMNTKKELERGIQRQDKTQQI